MSKDRTKPCVKCGAVERYKGNGACRPCNLILLANHRRDNPDYDKNWQRDNPELKLSINRKNRYGLEQEQYEIMFITQNGKCAICKNSAIRDVDHNHNTGKIRGLLCHQCNIMLGNAKDNPEILRLGADYLEEKE